MAGLPNVRRVLSREYVHYLPYFTRRCIEDLSGKEVIDEGRLNIDSEDFIVEYKLSHAEEELFDEFRLTTEQKEMLVESLHKYSVAIVEKSILVTVISDMLADVEHPKKMGLKVFSGGVYGFMKIAFCMDEVHMDRPAVSVSFENLSSEEDYGRSHGNTWAVTTLIMQNIGGRADDSYDDGVLCRKLVFPAIRQRTGG